MESPGPGGPRWFERAPLKPLATFDEDFEPLGAEIGRGASGIVKRSVRRSDGAAVAVKVIDVQKLRVTNAFSTTRMRREVDVMLGLRHRNIVELHGAYADDDRVWLVMELVTGGELFEAILARGAFSEDAARPIARELASAVAFMRASGVR